MHYTGRKGWQASYKDTWSLPHVLSPIIAAGVRKYIDVIKEKGYSGIPSMDPYFGEVDEESHEYKDWEAALEKWFETLETIFYAFDNHEDPDIPKGLYDKWPTEDGEFDLSDLHTKPELLDDYNKSVEEWDKKRQEGIALFAKYFDSLWW